MLLQVLLTTSCAGFLPAIRPSLPTRSTIRMQFAQPPDLSDETVYPRDPDGNILISWASLDNTAQQMIEMALADRNKERILAGEPKYESVQAMVDAYVAFEGEEKGMSRAQCEDAVLRFLQRKALLSEGGADMSDPQTIVTFALLALILVGGAYNLAIGNVAAP